MIYGFWKKYIVFRMTKSGNGFWIFEMLIDSGCDYLKMQASLEIDLCICIICQQLIHKILQDQLIIRFPFFITSKLLLCDDHRW